MCTFVWRQSQSEQIHQLVTALKPGAGAEKDRFLEFSFLLIFRLTLSATVTII